MTAHILASAYVPRRWQSQAPRGAVKESGTFDYGYAMRIALQRKPGSLGSESEQNRRGRYPICLTGVAVNYSHKLDELVSEDAKKRKVVQLSEVRAPSIDAKLRFLEDAARANRTAALDAVRTEADAWVEHALAEYSEAEGEAADDDVRQFADGLI